jgi:hypothetical protein
MAATEMQEVTNAYGRFRGRKALEDQGHRHNVTSRKK